MKTLISENFNMALIDSDCTRRVSVETWFQQVKLYESKNLFKFGDNKSLRKAQLRINIAGVSAKITTQVVAYDIPLVLTKEATKKANAKMDFRQGKLSIFGKIVDIKFTSTGHYCINLDRFGDENACKTNAVFFCKNIDELNKYYSETA